MAARYALQGSHAVRSAGSNRSATLATRPCNRFSGGRNSGRICYSHFDMTVRMLALFSALSIAAAAQIPAEPPKVLRLVREIVKPGKAAAHEKLATISAHAMARWKYPVNLLALSALTGDEEGWTLESHDSFASVENAETFIEKSPALKWSLGQYEAQDGELVSARRRMLAAYRKDLSYRGEQLAQNLPKMRYM